MLILDNMSDINIRANLLLGSYLAGIALMNAGSGPAGALSYALGANYKVPHGMAGAVFLAPIVEYNVSKGYEDYAELYDLIEGVPNDIPKKEKNIAFVGYMKKLEMKMKIPKKLSHFGLKKEDASFLIDQYDMLKNGIAQNPIAMAKEDISLVLNNLS